MHIHHFAHIDERLVQKLVEFQMSSHGINSLLNKGNVKIRYGHRDVKKLGTWVKIVKIVLQAIFIPRKIQEETVKLTISASNLSNIPMSPG